MDEWLEQLCANTTNNITTDSVLHKYIDDKYKIPNVYKGTGEIKLIILGQDPTIKNSNKRKNVKMVLDLDKKGSLRFYISGICKELKINLDENVYATNLLKNFFCDTPINLEKLYRKPIILKFSELWIEVLKKELEQYPNIPVLTLGEPILNVLVNDEKSKKVRDYWGYTSEWKKDKFADFNYIKAADNKLNTIIIPFPHQQSSSKEFYKKQFHKYCDFIKQINIVK